MQSSTMALRPFQTIKTSAPLKSRRVLRVASSKDGNAPSTSGQSEPSFAGLTTKMPYVPIAGLASLGALETAYLTATKFLGSDVACPISGGGCASVLTSSYATLLNTIPLSALGFLTYVTVTAVAIAGARSTSNTPTEPHSSPLRSAVLAGGLLLSTTSAYLMYILFTQFPGELCPYCIASAGLSATILGLALSTMKKADMEDAVMPGTGLISLTILILSLGLGNPNMSQAGSGITELEYKVPVITTESSPQAIAVGKKLKEMGAKMYGAFWCSHCYEQKQVFGKDAEFPYVECYPEGWKQGIEMAAACKDVGLEGFPTWVIGGEKIEGDQTLEQLEAAMARVSAPVAAVN